MERITVVIYGGGGFGREIAWLVESCSAPDKRYNIAYIIDDAPESHGTRLNDIEVVSLETARARVPGAQLVSAIGVPKLRETLTIRAKAAGFEPGTFVHPRVERSGWIEIGEGTVICAGNTLTTNIRLGRHVQINLGCTVGHDVVMGDFTTLAPGVHVSGWVHFGRRVYVGSGAVLINGHVGAPLTVGDDAVIGAGACVVRSVPPGITVAGVPAKELVRREAK